MARGGIVIFGAMVPHAEQASGGFVNRDHLAGFLEIALAVGIGLLTADTGAIGLCIIGLFALMPLGAAILAQARRRDPLARGMGFAVVMGVTAIAGHSPVDFNLQIPENAFAFMILLAFGWLSLYLGRSGTRAASGPEGFPKTEN